MSSLRTHQASATLFSALHTPVNHTYLNAIFSHMCVNRLSGLDTPAHKQSFSNLTSKSVICTPKVYLICFDCLLHRCIDIQTSPRSTSSSAYHCYSIFSGRSLHACRFSRHRFPLPPCHSSVCIFHKAGISDSVSCSTTHFQKLTSSNILLPYSRSISAVHMHALSNFIPDLHVSRSTERPCPVPVGGFIHVFSFCDIAAVQYALVFLLRHHASDHHIMEPLTIWSTLIQLSPETQRNPRHSLPIQKEQSCPHGQELLAVDTNIRWSRTTDGVYGPSSIHAKGSESERLPQVQQAICRASLAQLCSHHI